MTDKERLGYMTWISYVGWIAVVVQSVLLHFWFTAAAGVVLLIAMTVATVARWRQ